MKKIHLLTIIILMFNCHNAQKKWGHNKYPWKNR